MANPQNGNGHTDLSNELLEKLAGIRISGEEWQVLLVILRKTDGWHKDMDNISLSQFVELTHLKKPNIIRAVKNLLTKNLIVIKKDNESLSKKITPIVSYGIQKDYEKWRPLSKKITLSKMIKPVINIDNKSLSILITETDIPVNKINTLQPPKETTKETIQKKTNRDDYADTKKFIDWYHDKYLETFGCKPDINGGKDGSLVKRLLEKYDLSKLIEMGEMFFKIDDAWLKTTGYTLGVFSSQINKLIVRLKNKNTSGMTNAAGQPLEYIKWADAPAKDKKNAK